jgi:hypothetical protein
MAKRESNISENGGISECHGVSAAISIMAIIINAWHQ